MATSGSVDFSQTRQEVIQDALALIGVYGVGRTVSSEDMNFCNNMLNKMIKAWQAQGMHLWAEEQGVLFIAANTAEYTLSADSTSARAALWSDTVITQLNGAHAASATTLTVDDTTGMATSDIIGIVNDDDAITWTTISTIPTSTSLTIAAGLDGACADNSYVYTFTNRINKPLRIKSMRRVTGIDSGATTTKSEIPMTKLSQEDYYNLPNKTTNGIPSHFYFKPDLTTGLLYLWPRPNNPDYYFRFTYERFLEDMDADGDNFDFPVEWLECLTYQLAVRIAPAFGRDQKLLTVIAPLASNLLENMMDWDHEVVDVQVTPDRSS